MTLKTRRRLRVVAVLLVVSVLSACMFLPDYPRLYKSGKYDPVEETAPKPARVATTPKAEKQTEPHTCGWHAMRSMYAAYGLDGRQFDLRFRLGTDEPAMRADKDSTGTLHPDLYRVLAQDGFAAEPMDLDGASPEDRLDTHLMRGQLALVVVYRSTYHWVLVGPSETEDACVVYDSLVDGPVALALDALVDDALSITLVRPAEPGQAVSTTDAHAEGLAEMARLYRRKE